jgi:glutamate-ammonia-ligase adenylyltransferase
MTFSIRTETLPAPHDPAWAQAQSALVIEQMKSARQNGPDGALRVDSAHKSLLLSVFGNSPFLGQCLLLETPTLARVLTEGPDAVFNKLVSQVEAHSRTWHDESELKRQLRSARRQAAMVIALADIAGVWPLERVTQALSDFADRAVGAAAAHLLRHAARAGDIDAGGSDPMQSGVVVLALGKLGARELNYSSDVDLIVLFDPDRLRYRGRRSAQEFMVRFARDIVRLLQEVTQDGYVLRVDLRLRPDPASTPLALSVLAAETYYEGMGQNWERAAMIKARAIAGDLNVGQQFLRNLRPFIWRKHLDFAAIEDIHSIKRQIHAVKGHREIAVAGHNIKIGRGGIREIEFFAQTQQLIWGGRAPDLRLSATCEAIEALVRLGRTRPEVGGEMIAAYRYLRQVEHRLQMIDDRQTQTLPAAGPELSRLALFCGHRDVEEFSTVLLRHMGAVEDRYAELFEESKPLGEQGNLVFTGTEDDPETVNTLRRMGFPDGRAISGQVRAWHHGRYRATRSARARELLTELMPTLLGSLARTADPDMAFRRFDDFLRALPAGVQVFALIQSNPDLLELIAEIMGSAPFLADRLSRHPMLLDGLLTIGRIDALPDAGALMTDLHRQLSLASDFQDRLGVICRWTKDRQFQAGVRLLRDAQSADRVGGELSEAADAAIRALFPIVAEEFERHHGRLPGRGMAVAAMGKLGSGEMTITSDLDLIFVYDAPDDVADWETHLSDGARRLPPMQYFARLAQRFITVLTAPMEDGKLYDVDMRLRPSGNAGPIASALPAFERYQRQEAWSWEHMALTRARVIAGEASLVGDFEQCLMRILTAPRDAEKLRSDALEMRALIRKQHPGDEFWDLKHRLGGEVDIDFIAQYLMLRHAHAWPAIVRREPFAMLRALAEQGLMDGAISLRLRQTGRLLRNLQQLMRLLVAGERDPANWREPTKRRLAVAGDCPDFSTLTDLVREATEIANCDSANIFAIDQSARE